MLLNYYTAFLEKHLIGKSATLINKDGITKTFSSLYDQSNVALPMLAHQYGSIIVGSDNTPETGDSYYLKKEITSGMYVAAARSVVDNADGSHSSIVIANCTNTSSSPITIGEIGLLVSISTLSYNSFLLDRTPLGTPLTIQPGEVGRIVYTITMS